ncbi:Outer membrane protein N precursor [Escherichia coli]|nr:Outer membrane protein N precursor [Escherichia coli]
MKPRTLKRLFQYQFDFGLRPSLGYVYSKGKDIKGVPGHRYVDADRVNYIEVGTWYYFNKNMNVYTAYNSTCWIKMTPPLLAQQLMTSLQLVSSTSSNQPTRRGVLL